VRVLHISKYDRKGGASRAAYNSVISQRSSGIEAELLVGRKLSADDFVHSVRSVSKLPILFRFVGEKSPHTLFGNADVRSLHVFGLRAETIERVFRPDLVVLHKVDGIVAVSELEKFTVPVIWRIHDMWPICGSQHYQADEQVVGPNAPHWTGNRLQRAIDNRVFEYKRRIYDRARQLSFCPPSHWLGDCLRQSPIFDRPPSVEVVPNGIDTATFTPVEKNVARQALGLPEDAKIVLFGAASGANRKRKGFDLLIDALNRLDHRTSERTVLLVFGDKLPEEIDVPNITVSSVGAIRDDEMLARIYSAADLLVSPSRQENLSLTVLESLACGTPVVAFDIGGMPDMISDGHNGWLARPFDVDDLHDKIHTAISLSAEALEPFGISARQTVMDNFSLQAEAVGMQRLFRRILDQEPG
jgi:glycosyltransferase involved in cell wall biosynthesis